jgi:hypothetical protein
VSNHRTSKHDLAADATHFLKFTLQNFGDTLVFGFIVFFQLKLVNFFMAQITFYRGQLSPHGVKRCHMPLHRAIMKSFLANRTLTPNIVFRFDMGIQHVFIDFFSTKMAPAPYLFGVLLVLVEEQ